MSERGEVTPDSLERNRCVGWVSLSVGAATGLLLGLWSFDGPVAVPEWLGAYGDTSRRLARLGHIACFGLGILNLLLASALPRSRLGAGPRRTAAGAMNFGNVFLPLVLFGAAIHAPLKYALSVPALAVFLALAMMAWGVRPGEGQRPSTRA